MEGLLPDTLEPVSYFLQRLDTPEWLWVFRIAAIVAALVSTVVFFRFIKRLPKDDEQGRRKKKG